MRALLFVFPWIMVSCSYQASFIPGQEISLSKQKQKIGFLQKKLLLAEKEEEKLRAEVERLGSEVCQAQLTLIRRQIDEYEESVRKQGKKVDELQLGNLFLKEREQLHRMIQSGSSVFDAQLVLDRILQLITELSDALPE